jgi:Amt family ammonium transporter
MSEPLAAFSDPARILCFLCALMVPCAIAGLALINAGLGRSRSAAHALVGALCVAGVAALAYFAMGFAIQGYAGLPAHELTANGKLWSWAGAGRPFFGGVRFDGAPESLAALLGMFSVALAAMIPLGAGADRWRLGASCASTAILAAVIFPVFAHWGWGGGWLAQLGANAGLGAGFIDAGGAGSIQVVGGLSALAVAWLLGPRRGKYSMEGMPAAIPGHNAVFVLFGCFLAWFGWIGLDCAGALLYSGMDASRVPLIAVNATLGAAAAGLAAAGITRARFTRTDASLCANAWVAGLVASSAGCALLNPAEAVIVGLVAGALAVFSVEWLELRLTVDDPGGAISVHALGGLWGLLAVGLFAPAGNSGQWLAQLIGVATLLGFVLPAVYGLNWLLDRFYRQRVAPEGERQGLDLYELGAGAYPDFMTHSDDSWQR